MDFRIWGGGGLKFHSQRPRNPLTSFGRIHSKAWGRSLDLGPSDPGLDCDKAWENGLNLGPSDSVWIVVKPERQGDKRFLKDSDGFLMAFQVLFVCDRSTDIGVIMVWWGWRQFNLWIPLVILGLVVLWDPTFMLGIWNGGDWLKERFGSTMSMVGWVEVPNLVGFPKINKN